MGSSRRGGRAFPGVQAPAGNPLIFRLHNRPLGWLSHVSHCPSKQLLTSNSSPGSPHRGVQHPAGLVCGPLPPVEGGGRSLRRGLPLLTEEVLPVGLAQENLPCWAELGTNFFLSSLLVSLLR